MNRIKYIIGLLTICVGAMAQSSTQNYISTTIPTVGVTVTTALTTTNANSTIQYYDGLGRPVETVQKTQTSKDGGATWVDMVSTTEYDALGREYRHWLPAPATGSTGAFINTTDFSTLANAQYTGSEKPYATTNFEPSPLNRVTEQYKAGNDWYVSGKKVSSAYKTNIAYEVICFYVNASKQLVRNGFYAAKTLFKTSVTDEDGAVSSEYKDYLGRLIMKRSEEGGYVDTYYVYNDFNQLCFVLSPKATDELASMATALSATNSNSLGRLGYAYQYDDRGNCIWKKLPGCEPIYMVYDQADRLVLSQDGNQRVTVAGKKQWTVTKYDGIGRMVFTGITKDIDTTKTLTDLVTEYKTKLITESYTDNLGYSNTNFLNATLLTLNFYDTYNYQNITAYKSTSFDLGYKDFSASGFDTPYGSAKGLLTGTVTAVLDNPNNLLTAMYYDYRGRVVQARSNNHLGGYDYEYYHNNFSGQPLAKQHVHKTPYIASELTENYRYYYDRVGRLTSTRHKICTQTEVILDSMQYDALGRMTKKILNGGGEAIDYTYNIRNWTKSISSPRFSETMYYQDALDSKPVCYNGNISAVKWGAGITQDKKYYYTYDKLNRMKKATYWPDETYNEEITQYDKNGNILGLNRNGYVHDWESEFPVFTGPIDEMSFEYNGNQMRNVWDNLYDQDILNATTNDFRNGYAENTPDYYLYDKNGNQYADLNKGIAWIQYNLLNLPSKIQFSNGNKNEYLYDASGVKRKATYSYAVNPMQIPLGQTATENTGANLSQNSYTDYCGNYVYENGKIKRILTPEGYIETGGSIPMNSISSWRYDYLLKDHLGNTRQLLYGNSISTQSPTLTSSNTTIDYYPFGMEIEKMDNNYSAGYAMSTLPGTVTPYLYNGKEMDRMNGLNSYDYGARWRDGIVGGWPGVDPLAEKYYSISPYVYCKNDPVNYIDPDGMDWYTSTDGKNVFWQDGNKKVDGYTNSETYTKKIDDHTSITYTQNNATSVTFTGIDKSDYVSQTGKTGCKVASDQMLANDGVNSKGERINVVNADANGVASTPTKKADKGIKAVDNALENGHPIEVGVDYSPVQLHNKKSDGGDGMTDHFIVISSKTETLNNGQVTSSNYNFFDPRKNAYGTNTLNVLTRQNNMLKGAYHQPDRQINYTVTTVRTSSR